MRSTRFGPAISRCQQMRLMAFGRRAGAIIRVDGGTDDRSARPRTRFRAATSILMPSRSCIACTSTISSAYLVGGSVRDLLLGRRPKDFDIGTSAHPHQVKKLFRNCWIIGRRFRLAHVKFGPKTIEVATFRRQVDPADLPPDVSDRPGRMKRSTPRPTPAGAPARPSRSRCSSEGTHLAQLRARDRMIHRDNTFGTPEEDAFRRDFTINALFYDIAHLLDHRLRRRPRGSRSRDDPVDRRSGRALYRRSGTHAARCRLRRAARLLDRSSRSSTAIDSHRHEIGTPRRRG